MQKRTPEAGTLHPPTYVSLWHACTFSSLLFCHFSPAPIVLWTHWHHKVCRTRSLYLCLWHIKTPGPDHDQHGSSEQSGREQSTQWEKRLIFTCLAAASCEVGRSTGRALVLHVCNTAGLLLTPTQITHGDSSPSGHHGWKLLFPKEEQFGYSAMGNKMFAEMVGLLLPAGRT